MLGCSRRAFISEKLTFLEISDMPILEKVCISLHLGFPFHWPQCQPELTGPIGPYWTLFAPYWSLFGPYCALFDPYCTLFGPIGSYLALTI